VYVIISNFTWAIYENETILHFIIKREVSPITGLKCPEGYRKLRFPDYVTMAQEGVKFVSLTPRPLFTPRKYSWYSFLLEVQSSPGL